MVVDCTLYAKYPRNRGSFDIFRLLFEVFWGEKVCKEKQELFGGDVYVRQ